MRVSGYRVWNIFRRAIPFIVSAALLFYYFHKVDWPKVFNATSEADLWLLVLGRAAPVFIYWWFYAIMTHRLISWFHKPVPFRDILWAKGALTLLLLLNVAFSSGGYFIYLVRKAEISPARLLGMLIFGVFLMITGYVIILTPCAVFITSHPQVSAWFANPSLVWLLLALGWLWLIYALSYWRLGWSWGLLSTLVVRRSEFWHVFARARMKHWLKTWAYILPPNLFSFAGYYLCALAFDIHIPVVEFFILIPLVIVVSGLPIAFGGFGTTTAAWLYFFPQYADRETFLALTLVLPAITFLSRAMVGIISLKPAYSEWDQITSKPGVRH